MDPLSALGSGWTIITIASAFQQLCKKLHRFARNLKQAQTGVILIKIEIETFWRLLKKFHKLVEDADSSNEGFSVDIKRANISASIIEASRYNLKRLRSMLAKIEPLRADKSKDYTFLARWVVRWQWSDWKKDWDGVQSSLNSTKQSADLLLSMVILETQLRIIMTLQRENKPVPVDMTTWVDCQKDHINHLQASVRRSQRHYDTLELGEDGHALQINISVTETTRGIVRSYIKHHQDIKTILTSDAPISSLVVKLGASNSPSGDAGSQTSSRGPIVDTPDTSLVIESSEGSRDRDLFTEEVIDVPDMNDDLMNYTATFPSDHTECDRGCTPHSEPQRPMQTFPPAGWVPTALFGPPMPKARPPNPRPPTPLPPSEDAAVNQGDGSAGRYDYPPPEKPGGPAHKASVPQARRSELRPPTPDAAPQDIIVDRNDDLGVRHEYRPPRKPRRPPRSLE